MRFLILLTLSVLFNFTSYAEKTAGSFSSVKANAIAEKFKVSYQGFYEKFNKSMIAARTFAAKQGNIEEVKKIQEALNGKFSSEFATNTAKSAVRNFKYSISRLYKDYIADLKKVVKDELTAGNIQSAEEIQSIIAKIEPLSTSSSTVTKSCRISADENWQDSKIFVNKGDKLTIYCLGTWTPNRQISKQDADRYNVQIKIGNLILRPIGKKKDMIADASGEMAFRMLPPRKHKKKDPSGSLSIKVVCEPKDSFQEMHDLVLGKVQKADESTEKVAVKAKKRRKAEKKQNILARNATSGQEDFTPHPPGYVQPTATSPLTEKKVEKKYRKKAKTVEIYGNKDWQSSGVVLPAGVPVLVTSSGKWSRGKLKKGKIELHDIDDLKIEGKIGEGHVIHGGKVWLISAEENKGGLLKFRMHDYCVIKKKHNPQGIIKVTTKILSPEEAATLNGQQK
jgi:hypothetical protein